MSTLQEFTQKLNSLFNTITDWLLIVMGTVLIIKAIVAIDVPLARYAIMGVGGLLIAAGFWYRHRRKRRHR